MIFIYFVVVVNNSFTKGVFAERFLSLNPLEKMSN